MLFSSRAEGGVGRKSVIGIDVRAAGLDLDLSVVDVNNRRSFVDFDHVSRHMNLRAAISTHLDPQFLCLDRVNTGGCLVRRVALRDGVLKVADRYRRQMLALGHRDGAITLQHLCRLRVFNNGIYVLLRMHEEFLRAVHVRKTQLVRALSLVRLTADAHRLATAAVVGIRRLAVEDPADNDGVVGIALIERDNHFLTDAWNGAAAPSRSCPGLRYAHPDGV